MSVGVCLCFVGCPSGRGPAGGRKIYTFVNSLCLVVVGIEGEVLNDRLKVFDVTGGYTNPKPSAALCWLSDRGTLKSVVSAVIVWPIRQLEVADSVFTPPR